MSTKITKSRSRREEEETGFKMRKGIGKLAVLFLWITFCLFLSVLSTFNENLRHFETF